MKIDYRNIQLRPETPADLEFLSRLYASTRQQELAVTGWPQAQIDTFLSQQFQAQHAHYLAHYATAAFQVIEYEGIAIGRLYLARRDDEYRLMDIALLPDYRGHGLGGHLIRDVLDEADKNRLTVRIHVEQFNPALHLYERLGFRVCEERGVHLYMERLPVD